MSLIPDLSRRHFLAGTGLAALGVSVGAPFVHAQSLRPVSFRLNYVANAEHAPYYVGVKKGFYKEAGFDVAIAPGTGSNDTVKLVGAGNDMFGVAVADAVLVGRGRGVPVVSTAVLLQQSPNVLASLTAKNITKPEDLLGKKVGMSSRSTVFAYNKDKLKEDQLPKSLMDLADPSWKGRWAASPSGADFQAIVSALLELKDEQATADWLKGMKENFTAYRGNGTVMKAVNAGEVEGGIIYHYYWFGDQAKTGENSNNVALHYFKNQDPGAFVSISGGGVLASSKHPKEAQAFLKWVAGKGGQDVLKNGTSYEYAVGVGAESNPKLVPLADLQAPKVEPSMLNAKKVTDLMTAAGLL